MNAEEEFFRKASAASTPMPPAFYQAAEQSNMANDISEIRKHVRFIATIIMIWVFLSILGAILFFASHH